MINRIKTILVVTLVTLLIWLWAETESLQTSQLAARVRLVEAPGVVVAEPADWNGVVKLTVTGSDAGIRAAQRAIEGGLGLSLPKLGVTMVPGEHYADLSAYFESLDTLQRLGLVVTSVDPASIKIWIPQVTPPPVIPERRPTR